MASRSRRRLRPRRKETRVEECGGTFPTCRIVPAPWKRAATLLLAVARLDAHGDDEQFVLLGAEVGNDGEELAATRLVGDLAHLRGRDLQLNAVVVVGAVLDGDDGYLVGDEV